MNTETSVDQLFLNKVHEAIENNLANENFGVDELAFEIGISRSQLHRRLNTLDFPSASQMIKEHRLKKAMEMLQNNVGTASEISYQVGYKNPSHFNTSFNEYFGYPPGKVKYTGSFRKKDKPVTSSKWKIASYISFIVIIALIVLYIIPRTFRSIDITNLEKSIAVLPFDNMSNDEADSHLGDAFTDEIIMELQKIRAFDRVLSRSSTMKYKDNRPPIPVIAEEMNVNYIIEGSVQRKGDSLRVRVQLIRAQHEDHVWGNEYDFELKDIFSIQDEIAEKVAEELKAIITPEEKQLIEKIPTRNREAYYFYQKGRDEYSKFSFLYNYDTAALERAEVQYYKALKYDSKFAQAYAGLAGVYFNKKFLITVLSENYLDSVRVFADIALSYDNQLAEAYSLKGNYYRENGDTELALKEFDKAIKLNPNEWIAYYGKGWLYMHDDLAKSIDNYQKAASLNRGSDLPEIIRWISAILDWAGFKEQAIFYSQEALKLDDDSADHYQRLGVVEYELNGNLKKAIKLFKKGYAIDSTKFGILHALSPKYMLLGKYEEALKYYKKLEETPFGLSYARKLELGYVYFQLGYKDKAEYYFNEVITDSNRSIELGRRSRDERLYYNLAMVYAFKEEKEKAYKYLRTYIQRQIIPNYIVVSIKDSPLFDSMRDEPEFQQIVGEVEAKYQAEHERVRQWLDENDVL